MPDEAERGGGLVIATINLAIALGAFLGGRLLDGGGVAHVFMASGVLLCLATLVVLGFVREVRAGRNAVQA